MIAEPLNVLVTGDASLAHRAPDLDHPGVRTEHGVEPILSARDDFFRVIFELVEHADRRIAGQLLALLALRLEHPQILRRHFVVGLGTEGPQQHAAPGVKEQAAANIAMAVDELHTGAHFRLAGREITGTQLLAFAAPFFREIAVEIEAGFRARDRQIEAVVVLDATFGHDAEIFATGFHRIATHHQARLGGMLFPWAVGIRDAHHQDAAIAVDIFGLQPLNRILVVGVRACRGADVFRFVGHRPLGTVRVHARDHVQRARVEQARDVVLLAVIGKQRIDEFQRRDGAGKFGRVNVGVDVKRRFGQRLAGGVVGNGDAPDRAALVAGTDGGYAS